MKLGAIILSGGKSSRFGTDKGLYPFNGSLLVEHAIVLAQNFTSEIVISANHKEYEKFGYLVVNDIYKNLGPMGGLYSAFQSIEQEINLVLPCDSPFLSQELIKQLIENYNNEEVLIFKTSDGKIHPLFGLYQKSILKSLFEHIQLKKLKLINFILSRSYKIIELEENDAANNCFVNFNFIAEINESELKTGCYL